jgi:hypothetical protein
MQLTVLEGKDGIRIFWGLAVLLAAVMFFTAKTQDPGLLAGSVFLAMVAIMPLYLWLLGWSQGLPAWQIFAFVTGLTYALPMIQSSRALIDYTPGEIIAGAMVTVGFILLGTLMSLAFENRTVKPPKNLLMITQKDSIRYLLLFVCAGLLFGLNEVMHLVAFPGNSKSVVRGICGSLSTMGLFVLAYYKGRGLLDKRSDLLFVLGAVGTITMGLCSLMLAEALVPVSMVLFGYTLGSSKVPWRLLAALFVIMSLLHAGKYEMRALYWGGEQAPEKQLTLWNLPGFFGDWTRAGLEELGGFKGVFKSSEKIEGESQSSFFERSGNLHMLLLVMRKTPSEVPYCNGATYAPIPGLLVPRFLNDQKGISHVANQFLSANYGVVALESVGSVSIGWGLLPEAYANFGLVGVMVLALVLAAFYSWVSRLTVGVPMTSLRFVIGLLIISAATRADTMAIFVTSQFQGIMGVSIAAYLLMRRQSNPFYNADAGVRAAAGPGQGMVDGLPAPGLLSDLIEGSTKKRSAGRMPNGTEYGPERAIEGVGPQTAEDKMQNSEARRQLAADGAVVRTTSIRTPKRIASWMPRRVRAAVVAQYAEEEEPEGTETPKDGSERPRQLAVPYQNYRRYRG